MKNLGGLVNRLKTLDYMDIEIRCPFQICEHCDKKTDDVELTLNPYAHDIHNSAQWEFICQRCYGELCDDI